MNMESNDRPPRGPGRTHMSSLCPVSTPETESGGSNHASGSQAPNSRGPSKSLTLSQAEANSVNRGKMKYNHKTGSRSHVRVMTNHQAEEEDHEEEFTQIDLFRVTHTNEKGEWINDAVKEEYGMMCDLLVAPDVVVDGVVQPRLTDVEIIERVRGYRSGYIKGLGAGPAHSRVSSYTSSARSHATEDPRVTQLVLENKELKSKYNELKDNYDELRRDILEMKNFFSTFTPNPPS